MISDRNFKLGFCRFLLFENRAYNTKLLQLNDYLISFGWQVIIIYKIGTSSAHGVRFLTSDMFLNEDVVYAFVDELSLRNIKDEMYAFIEIDMLGNI